MVRHDRRVPDLLDVRRPGQLAPGTYWWGADNNLGFFGFESVTDGTANTGLFSEKLLGWSTGNNGAA